MKIKRVLGLFALSAILALAAYCVLRVNFLPSSSARLEAEKDIYHMLLVDASYNDSVECIPLADFTTLGGFDEQISKKNVPLIVDGFPLIKRETFVDLKDKNKQSYGIRDFLPSQISKKMIGQQGYWISFSRIGFDSYLTQAIVAREQYSGCNSNGYCSYSFGELFFLQNVDDKWIIKDRLNWWLAEEGA